MANKRGFGFFSFFHILENLTPDVGVFLDIFSLVEKVNYQEPITRLLKVYGE